MSYVVKAALFCDKCGKRVDVEPGEKAPSLVPMATKGTDLEGWLDIKENHHLCPECASAYLARKAEMEKELKELAGIREVSFDL